MTACGAASSRRCQVNSGFRDLLGQDGRKSRRTRVGRAPDGLWEGLGSSVMSVALRQPGCERLFQVLSDHAIF